MTYGQPAWFELFTTNTDDAVSFYGELFNWSLREWKSAPEAKPYRMFCVGEKPVAGLNTNDASATPNQWLAYVSVPDANSARTTMQAAGALVLQDEAMESVGRWVVAKDPQGATFSAFQPKDAPTAPSMAVGNFCWHELMTTDREAAYQFYQKIFGWQNYQSIDMGPMGTYQLFGIPQPEKAEPTSLGGMMNLTPDMPKKPYWLEYIAVDDTQKAVERAQQLGGKICFPVMPVMGGSIAGLMDRQGITFAVWSASK
jgi:hypothetical protein